ncbi:MAG: GNAT family N-acetyltransferase [Candidatus Absconditabacterales bacterium]|nr:GNAT family N-acetyltransferase [Candidatus Absconditabacterales bacterium]
MSHCLDFFCSFFPHTTIVLLCHGAVIGGLFASKRNKPKNFLQHLRFVRYAQIHNLTYLSFVVVDKTHRGNGLGTFLITESLRRYHPTWYLYPRTQSLIDFYRKMGAYPIYTDMPGSIPFMKLSASS